MFGMSFVYIIFDDDVDVYWARTRVMERLNYAQRLLPQRLYQRLVLMGQALVIYWYHLDAPQMELGEQRIAGLVCQVSTANGPGVVEVASFGGYENNIS
jgi:Cu(I)/Ag(I) efflux system membrane protein CusA/SilA